MLNLFVCPVCQSPLLPNAKIWQCAGQNLNNQNPNLRQHSFDVAKQGYVNLLPVQHKHSKNPGDTDNAIKARQQFLAKGHYQGFRQSLLDFAKDSLTPIDDFCWLDIGCGEGYYSQKLFEQVFDFAQQNNLNNPTAIALDISKPAVTATAKALKNFTKNQVYSCVASASNVPILSGTVNVISTIFSPILPEEFYRLLAKDGFLLIGKPKANHLFELRQAIFDRVEAHDSQKFVEQLTPLFHLIKEQHCSYQIQLNATELADLLAMTPYAYRAKPERIQALLSDCEQQGQMIFTVDFLMYLLKKVD